MKSMKNISKEKVRESVSDFLEKNPHVKEALEVFEISHSQYQKARNSGQQIRTVFHANEGSNNQEVF